MSGWTVLIFILVLMSVGLLSVPLTLNGRGCLRKEDRWLEARIAWGGGLLAAVVGINGEKTSFGLRLAGIAIPVSRKKPGKAKTKKTGKKAGRKGERHGFNLSAVNTVLNRKLLTILSGYLKRIVGSCRIRLRLRGVCGADDPALTGLIAGLIAMLHTEHFNLNLDADFSGPILDVDGEASGRIIPVVILWLTIRLLLAEPVRKIWWTQLKNKFVKRKPKEAAQYV
ncbi:MAG: hypothetical protein K6T65_02050 [Peptococcaceae bacterium]|nr:hypothetical protein [Peptococcaceae bacterium]